MAVKFGLTVTTTLSDAVHPLESVMVTVYVVLAVGQTVIELVVPPGGVDHSHDTPVPDAVSVAQPP